MSTLTDVQIITKDGKPEFAVLPYKDYLRLIGQKEVTVPHEVVEYVLKNDCNLVKAWRLHFKLTQKEVAEKAGITQSALSQIEKSENVRSATVEKIAAAMGILPEQLLD
jgi:DNA-binding Xre family transcriptional regulator